MLYNGGEARRPLDTISVRGLTGKMARTSWNDRLPAISVSLVQMEARSGVGYSQANGVTAMGD